MRTAAHADGTAYGRHHTRTALYADGTAYGSFLKKVGGGRGERMDTPHITRMYTIDEPMDVGPVAHT